MRYRLFLLGVTTLVLVLGTACTAVTPRSEPGRAETLQTQVATSLAPTATPRPPQPTVAPPAPTATVRVEAPVPAPTARPATTTVTPVPSPATTATNRPAWATQPGGFIYFLRDGSLWRYQVASGQETRVMEQVADFALSPNGRHLAVVRGRDAASEIWVAEPDGSNARRLTEDRRNDSGPVWSSRNVLAFVSSTRPAPNAEEGSFIVWTDWCAAAEIRAWEAASGVRSLARGCDPAWAPEGLRLAHAAPPNLVKQDGRDWPNGNTIRMVNAQGENGWDVVHSQRHLPANFDRRRPGLFLYRPVWAPDGKSIIYSRMVGYAILCDHSTVERVDPSKGGQGGVELLALGPDWLKTARVSPDGHYLAIGSATCNAAGFGGYNTVALGLHDLRRGSETAGYPIIGETGEEKIRLAATRVLHEFRLQSPNWAPTGAVLSYLSPPDSFGSQERTPDPASRFNSTDPGDLIVRDVATNQVHRLLQKVDFGSPIAWIP
jgi:hypothetical protein